MGEHTQREQAQDEQIRSGASHLSTAAAGASVGRHVGRVIIVTGAGSGIGRATAELLVAEGASVVAVDLDDRPLGWCNETNRAEPFVADVREADANASMVDLAVDRFGALHGIVLNAGVSMGGHIEQLPIERFDLAMEVNVRAVALGIRAAAPALREAGTGSIAVTASTSGRRGDPAMWAYNASKAAVINLVRAAALDLGVDGIRVNAVCPGPTHTAMTEGLGRRPDVYESLRRRTARQRWAEPSEVAEVFAFLLSPQASAVTGAAIDADGGVSANTGQFLPPER